MAGSSLEANAGCRNSGNKQMLQALIPHTSAPLFSASSRETAHPTLESVCRQCGPAKRRWSKLSEERPRGLAIGSDVDYAFRLSSKSHAPAHKAREDVLVTWNRRLFEADPSPCREGDSFCKVLLKGIKKP